MKIWRKHQMKLAESWSNIPHEHKIVPLTLLTHEYVFVNQQEYKEINENK